MSDSPLPGVSTADRLSSPKWPVPKVVTHGVRLSITPTSSLPGPSGSAVIGPGPSSLPSALATPDPVAGGVLGSELEGSPACVTFEGVTMVSDRRAVVFFRPGEDQGRALRWDVIRSVSVSHRQLGDVLAASDAPPTMPAAPTTSPDAARDRAVIVLESWRYRYVVELARPDGSAVQLTWALSTITPPGSLADDVLSASTQARASTTVTTPETLASRFDRVRPLVTVALVILVAAMAALVLAASVGAVHLSWLGSNGASTPSAALVSRR